MCLSVWPRPSPLAQGDRPVLCTALAPRAAAIHPADGSSGGARRGLSGAAAVRNWWPARAKGAGAAASFGTGMGEALLQHGSADAVAVVAKVVAVLYEPGGVRVLHYGEGSAAASDEEEEAVRFVVTAIAQQLGWTPVQWGQLVRLLYDPAASYNMCAIGRYWGLPHAGGTDAAVGRLVAAAASITGGGGWGAREAAEFVCAAAAPASAEAVAAEGFAVPRWLWAVTRAALPDDVAQAGLARGTALFSRNAPLAVKEWWPARAKDTGAAASFGAALGEAQLQHGSADAVAAVAEVVAVLYSPKRVGGVRVLQYGEASDEEEEESARVVVTSMVQQLGWAPAQWGQLVRLLCDRPATRYKTYEPGPGYGYWSFGRSGGSDAAVGRLVAAAACSTGGGGWGAREAAEFAATATVRGEWLPSALLAALKQ